MAEKEPCCLAVSGLSFSYDRKYPVLHGVCFRAGKGERIGLAGANGAGKSTLLKILVGLETDFEGGVEIAGISLTKKTLAEIRRHIGYVFQDSDSQLFMPTVREDVAFAPLHYGYPAEEVRERTERALKSVHAEHLADTPVYPLSGGEKKLVSIATVLSMDPDVCLMDEPSSGLDPKNRRNLIRVISSLDCLQIIASHDLDLLWDTCSRILLIDEGKLVFDGPSDELMRDEALLTAHSLELPLSLQRRTS